MKIGCATRRFCEQTEENTWAVLKEAGIEYVDGGLGEDGADGLDDQLMETLRGDFGAAGIKIWFVHAPFVNPYEISSPDSAKVELAIDAILACVKGCKALGGEGVVMHGSEHIKEPETAGSHMPRAKEALKRIVEYAAPLGVTIAIENLPPGYLGCRSSELLELTDPYDVDQLGICLDTGHANLSGGEGVDLIKDVAPLMVTTHLHDNDSTGDQHQLPGVGTINWDDVARALVATKYTGPVMFETAVSDSFEEMVRQMPDIATDLVARLRSARG